MREHIIATRYRAIARHPVALLGRFLPRLGRPQTGGFFLGALSSADRLSIQRLGPVPGAGRPRPRRADPPSPSNPVAKPQSRR